jgi:hypothetical protein
VIIIWSHRVRKRTLFTATSHKLHWIFIFLINLYPGCPGLGLPIYAFCRVGMTGRCQHAQLLVDMGVSLTFCLGWLLFVYFLGRVSLLPSLPGIVIFALIPPG